jgi:Interferon-induced 6-16 family
MTSTDGLRKMLVAMSLHQLQKLCEAEKLAKSAALPLVDMDKSALIEVLMAHYSSLTLAEMDNSALVQSLMELAKRKRLLRGVGAVAGACLAPWLVSAAVGAAGFGAAGIAANSWGAALMSFYGGATPAGSICAILQSVGATGLSSAASAVWACFGAKLGYTAAQQAT